MAKKVVSKALSVGLSLAMCAGLVAPALAVKYDISKGNVYVETNAAGNTVSWQGETGEQTKLEDSQILIYQTALNNTSTITVNGAGAGTVITLSGVDIDVSRGSSGGGAAMLISGKDTAVTVELDGSSTLTSDRGFAGLELKDGASVTIQDVSGRAGSLTATGGEWGSGIGSGYQKTAGNITITGGTVIANGGRHAAGIGSGNQGAAGDIEITGGKVTAKGGEWGSGIGSGSGNSSSNGNKVANIKITGGDVDATGGWEAAGIGTGKAGEVNTITISGVKVTAKSGGDGYSEDIGKGNGGTVGEIINKPGGGDSGADENGKHSWSGWKNNGENHSRTCTVCGAVETSGHSYGAWSDWDDNEEGTEQTRFQTCTSCGAENSESKPIVPPERPVEPDPVEEPDPPVVPGPPIVIDDPVVPLAPAPVDVPEDEVELEEIEDEAVPLAGLFTRADAIGYLWRQAGSPDAELSDFADVPEDHEWAVAIGWAQDMGIAVADEEGNFLPDDLLMRSSDEPEGEFQEFLNRYAAFAGIRLDDGELFIELDGEPDDIIMGEDAQVIFDDFFARLEEALAQAA